MAASTTGTASRTARYSSFPAAAHSPAASQRDGAPHPAAAPLPAGASPFAFSATPPKLHLSFLLWQPPLHAARRESAAPFLSGQVHGKVAHIVHGMVVLFSGHILSAPLIPAVQLHLPQAVPTRPASTSRPCRKRSAVTRMPSDTSLSAFTTGNPSPPQRLHEAGGGGSAITRWMVLPWASSSMARTYSASVRWTPSFWSRSSIPAAGSARPPPAGPTGRRTPDSPCRSLPRSPCLKRPLRHLRGILPAEKVVDRSPGRRPLLQHEPPVEHPGIAPLVSLPGSAGSGRDYPPW